MKRAGCPAWGSRASAASTRRWKRLDMRFHEIRTKVGPGPGVPAALTFLFASTAQPV